MEPREDGWLPFREHILLAPRGHRTEMGGRTFVWLGGAASVDRKQRLIADSAFNRQREHYGSSKRRKTWWEQEAITDADVARTAAGGHADVMVVHDAPDGIPSLDAALLDSEHLWNAEDLDYAKTCRAYFTLAVAGVKPDLLLHGHYHRPVMDDWGEPNSGHVTHVFGLSQDYDYTYGLGVLDTTDMSVAYLPAREPRE